MSGAVRSYDAPLFAIDDVEPEDPYIEVFGHRFYMRNPEGFSLHDNNLTVKLSQRVAKLDKMGSMREREEVEVNDAADQYLRHIAREPDVLELLLGDPRFSFMVKLRIIRMFNQLFSQAMTFEDELAAEASNLEPLDR